MNKMIESAVESSKYLTLFNNYAKRQDIRFYFYVISLTIVSMSIFETTVYNDYKEIYM